MNQYETVFILTPVLSDVQMKEAVEKFKGILTAEGAEIINEENWGLKKLAYPIQKKSTGFYQFYRLRHVRVLCRTAAANHLGHRGFCWMRRSHQEASGMAHLPSSLYGHRLRGISLHRRILAKRSLRFLVQRPVALGRCRRYISRAAHHDGAERHHRRHRQVLRRAQSV